MKKQYKTLVCKSGFTVSVQASKTNYCTPRNDIGPYTEVELGFPSAVEPLITAYAEDPSNLLSTVYGWVPTVVLFELISKHGGIAEGEIPPTNIFPRREKE